MRYIDKHRNRAMQRQIINGPAMREPESWQEPPAYVPPPSIDNPELPEIQPQFSVKQRLRVCRVERHGNEERYVLIAEVQDWVEGSRIAMSQTYQTRVMKFGEPRATRSNWQPVKVVA